MLGGPEVVRVVLNSSSNRQACPKILVSRLHVGNLELYVLMRPAPPAQADCYTPARPRAPSCVEGGVADSPGGAFLERVRHTTAPADTRRIFSVIGTNLFRCVGAISRLGAAVGCGRCGAVVGLGVYGASGVAPHPAPSAASGAQRLPSVVLSGAVRQLSIHASVKTASSYLQPMSVFLPPRASVACMVGAAAAHSQPPAAAMPAWSPCSALAPVRPPK